MFIPWPSWKGQSRKLTEFPWANSVWMCYRDRLRSNSILVVWTGRRTYASYPAFLFTWYFTNHSFDKTQDPIEEDAWYPQSSSIDRSSLVRRCPHPRLSTSSSFSLLLLSLSTSSSKGEIWRRPSSDCLSEPLNFTMNPPISALFSVPLRGFQIEEEDRRNGMNTSFNSRWFTTFSTRNTHSSSSFYSSIFCPQPDFRNSFKRKSVSIDEFPGYFSWWKLWFHSALAKLASDEKYAKYIAWSISNVLWMLFTTSSRIFCILPSSFPSFHPLSPFTTLSRPSSLSVANFQQLKEGRKWEQRERRERRVSENKIDNKDRRDRVEQTREWVEWREFRHGERMR